MNKMNNNPIEELRNWEAPVSEQEWASILHDKRYTEKFGRKPGLSPKGRAALIAGAAAVLITVPILIKTLSHKSLEVAQDTPPTTEVTVTAETEPAVTTATSTQTPVSAESRSESAPAHTPAKVEATAQSAAHERTTMTSITAARSQSVNEQPVTNKPANSQPMEPATQKPVRTVTQEPVSQPIAQQPTKKVTPAEEEETMSVSEETASKSEPEEVTAESDQFFIPSAFTPNGDGLNDLFYVQANFDPRNFDLTILNRSGEVVFHSHDITIGWDGKMHGSTLPNGMYVYVIKYKDRDGNDQKKQGQILLIP